MLTEDVYEELDARLGPVDAQLRGHYPGQSRTRQPVHTVYVPADRFHGGLVEAYGRAALAAMDQHGPLPFDADVTERVTAKLRREPIEDLRIDFEDGYGSRGEAQEDAAARSAATVVREQRAAQIVAPPDFAGIVAPKLVAIAPDCVGIRCKSLEGATRRRAIRTIDVFLDALGEPPAGFVVTLPKASRTEQVEAMVLLCERLERSHGLAAGRLRFEIQIETPPAVFGVDGAATVARMIQAAAGRCTGLHYGTYDYSAAVGVAAQYQSLEHPAADFAKAVMQVAAAGTGVRLSDGSTNIVPVGDTAAVRAAWGLHARLVRRSLERGYYQGWDLHPAQLPTRYAATYAFYRQAAPAASDRLANYLAERSAGVLDEPATARALARFLLRGLDCGALDDDEVGFDRALLEAQ